MSDRALHPVERRASARRRSTQRVAVWALLALFTVSCEREERRFREMPSAAARRNTERLVSLVPGPYTPDIKVDNPYGYNAFAISEGKRLFTWYNCQGCHANGGGGMGPPLMDDRWRYGSDPEQIFATIWEGRPNGMPSYRAKIPEQQVWQLVAYVQSLSGNVPRDAAGGRNDNMQTRKQEQALPDLEPEKEAAPAQ
jgi:cytochrome c oxidase cbb3-type subunit 3